MRRRFLTLIVCFAVAGLAAVPASSVSARARKFNALVFPDRSQPDSFVAVSDLFINETISNPEGDRFFVLHSPQGTFQLPFDAVAEVEFTRYLGAVRPDTVRYEVRMVLPAQGVRRGTIDLRVLRGFAYDGPWHDLLISRTDRGAGLFRILFAGPAV
jgi:hypothetical protein